MNFVLKMMNFLLNMMDFALNLNFGTWRRRTLVRCRPGLPGLWTLARCCWMRRTERLR